MKMKNTVIVNFVSTGFLLAVFLASASIACGQEPTVQSNAELASEAKFTIEQARKIALRQSPGKIESEKLVKENGKLFYFFEIRDFYEISVDVKVDAVTGEILSSEKENEIPNTVSNIKNGTVNGLKKVGQGIQLAANKVFGMFIN